MRLAIAVAVGLLAGCGKQPEQPRVNSSVAVVEAEPEPSLPGNATRVAAVLADVSDEWGANIGERLADVDDPHSGTTRLSRSASRSSFDIYIRADNSVWKVSARSGAVGRCGRTWENPEKVLQFVTDITGQPVSRAAIEKFTGSIRASEAAEPLNFGIYRLNGSGGCVQTLSLKAVTPGVDDA